MGTFHKGDSMATKSAPANFESNFDAFADRRIEAFKVRLNAFVERFANNPADALEWSEDVFAAAAYMESFKRIKEQIKRGLAFEDIRAGWLGELKRQASSSSSSTSRSANHIRQCRLVAIAEMVEELDNFE